MAKKSNVITLILGDEYDNELKLILYEILTNLGASLDNMTWGMAGSQELEIFHVFIDKADLKIESETYVGLSITGPSNLVNKIKTEVEHRPQI